MSLQSGAEWVDIGEAGRLLGIPTREVYRLVDAGTLPASKSPDNRERVRLEDIDAYCVRIGLTDR